MPTKDLDISKHHGNSTHSEIHTVPCDYSKGQIYSIPSVNCPSGHGGVTHAVLAASILSISEFIQTAAICICMLSWQKYPLQEHFLSYLSWSQNMSLWVKGKSSDSLNRQDYEEKKGSYTTIPPYYLLRT